MEVPSDQIRIRPSAFEIAAHVAHQLRPVTWTLAAYCVRLYVVVHHLIRIQFRAVARKEEQTYAASVFLQPLAHFLAAVDRVAVHDDEDLPVGLLHQAPQEAQKNRCGETLLEHHELHGLFHPHGYNSRFPVCVGTDEGENI